VRLLRACRGRDSARQAQVRYFPASDLWTPRGRVLRCEIDDDGPEREPVIAIDDQELSWREFGRLPSSPMPDGRIGFVPLHLRRIRPPSDAALALCLTYDHLERHRRRSCSPLRQVPICRPRPATSALNEPRGGFC
jgi:hypothetical protein